MAMCLLALASMRVRMVLLLNLSSMCVLVRVRLVGGGGVVVVTFFVLLSHSLTLSRRKFEVLI